MCLAIVLDLALMLYASVHGGALDPDGLVIDFLQIGVSLATLAYLVASRRVRVTYQWLIAADDPALAELTQPPPAPPGAPWLERSLRERS